MTISNTTRKVRYTGNGATVDFSFSFRILAASDLKIYVIDSLGTATLKTITTHYTVSFTSGAEGGTVTMVTAPSASEELLILRDLSLTQSTDFPTSGNIPEVAFENSLDRLTMLIQEQDEKSDRALSFAETSETTGIILPEPSSNQFLGWNGAATQLENKAGTTEVAIPSASNKKGLKWSSGALANTNYDVDEHEVQTVINTTTEINSSARIVFIDSSSGAVSVTMPASYLKPIKFIVTNATNTIEVTRNGSEKFKLTNGQESNSIQLRSVGDSFEAYFDGTNHQVPIRNIKVQVEATCTSIPPIASGTNVTINYNNELTDTHSAFDNTISKFVVPAGMSGRYLLRGFDSTEASSGTWAKNDINELKIRVNGSTDTSGGTIKIFGRVRYPVSTASATNTYLETLGVVEIFLNEGDYLNINKVHDASTTANTDYSEIYIARIGDV